MIFEPSHAVPGGPDRTAALPARPRRRWLAYVVGAAPLLLVASLCVLMRSEPIAVAAPLLGPWAGHLYGHAECTLASGMPRASATLVAFGVLAIALRFWAGARGGDTAKAWSRALLFVWLSAWAAFALLSTVNTMS